jgi:hypothetical protein
MATDPGAFSTIRFWKPPLSNLYETTSHTRLQRQPSRRILNQKLATLAAAAARDAGAVVTLISLRDFPMPLFDEDLETAEGMPEAAARLKALFAEHAGLIIRKSPPDLSSRGLTIWCRLRV